MELDLKKLIKKYNLNLYGVINIGSHYFQERQLFEEIGIKNYLLIEPQKHAFEETVKKSTALNNCKILNCALSDKEGEMTLYCDKIEVNAGVSSSLLKPKDHLKKFPWVEFNREERVNVLKLDNIVLNKEDYNFIFIDVQGNELNVFKGGENTLVYIDVILTEVNFIELYENCCLVEQLDEFLKSYYFVRVETGKDLGGYSDALYIKK